ncbi:MAG: hypothetical protein QM709_01745 [Spongiibacteraceae bacterium]
MHSNLLSDNIISARRAQRGVSLILVLFLLVVVSLLVAAIAQLNRGGSNAVSMEIQSTRALFAAESGAQIAAMQLFPISGNTPGCGAVTTPKVFAVGGLNNCSANLTCAVSNAAGRTVYTITSEGRCSVGSNDYARRRITVGLRSL